MEIPENLEEADETFRGKQVYYKEFESQRKKAIIKKCEYCGQKALKMLSNVKLGRGQYCSLSCSAKAHHKERDQSGENNPRYRGKQDYVDQIKKEGECKLCGEERVQALCFHHKNAENKVESVSRMAQRGKYSLEQVKEEVKKCNLICFNCHQIYHSNSSHP